METRYNSTPDMIIEQSDASYVMWFTFHSSGLLWELGPLLHRTEPAAPTHRRSLHPPAAAGLAHPHRHADGPADVHEQVYLKCTWPDSFLTFHPSPANLPLAKRGTFGPTPKDQSCLSFLAMLEAN